MDRILGNKDTLRELMKVTFERPHPLSPSPHMWRGVHPEGIHPEGEQGGEVEKEGGLWFMAN